jgi:hypothetical protein
LTAVAVGFAGVGLAPATGAVGASPSAPRVSPTVPGADAFPVLSNPPAQENRPHHAPTTLHRQHPPHAHLASHGGPNFTAANSLQFQPKKSSAARAPKFDQNADADADAVPGDPPVDAKSSHGASEKQRRDRINAMVDILRTLVPSASAGSGPDPGGAGTETGSGSRRRGSADPRRSKFVVLQDAINHIKEQHARIRELEVENRSLRAAVGVGPGQSGIAALGTESEAAAVVAARPVAAARAVADPSSAVPSSAGWVAVDVDKKWDEDNSYIRVRAPDRRGLLQDILTALYSLSMDIKRATVQQYVDSKTGVPMVIDIFELADREGMPRLSAEEVKTRIQRSLTLSVAEYEHPEGYARKRRAGIGNGS